jgi:hypothetical protein
MHVAIVEDTINHVLSLQPLPLPTEHSAIKTLINPLLGAKYINDEELLVSIQNIDITTFVDLVGKSLQYAR